MASEKRRGKHRYSQVSRRIFNDEKVQRLTPPQPCGQSLWVRILIGHEQGILPGLIAIGEVAFADNLGWDLEGFRGAFAELYREGLAKADWRARLIWVPNRIRHAPPANPNVVKSWADSWDELPECDLKHEAWLDLRAWMEDKGSGWLEAFDQSCEEPPHNSSGKPPGNPPRNPSGKGTGKQDQDQDQDQEGDGAPATPPSQLQLEQEEPPSKRPPRRSKMAGEKPVAICWRVWRELYAKQYGGAAYVQGGADGKAMGSLAAAAVAQAKGHPEHDLGDREGVRERTEAVFRHWAWSYLEDPGHNGYLVSEGHPLRCLDRDLARYGLPWGPRAVHAGTKSRASDDRPELQRLGGKS